MASYHSHDFLNSRHLDYLFNRWFVLTKIWHQSSTSMVICEGGEVMYPIDSPHKRPTIGITFPCHDVIKTLLCASSKAYKCLHFGCCLARNLGVSIVSIPGTRKISPLFLFMSKVRQQSCVFVCKWLDIGACLWSTFVCLIIPNIKYIVELSVTYLDFNRSMDKWPHAE